MHYVYVLKSLKNNKLYTGLTDNLKRRVYEHNLKSRKGNEWTKRNGPFKLVYYEAFCNKYDAIHDEKFFKSGYGREVLRQKLEKTLR